MVWNDTAVGSLIFLDGLISLEASTLNIVLKMSTYNLNNFFNIVFYIILFTGKHSSLRLIDRLVINANNSLFMLLCGGQFSLLEEGGKPGASV